MGLGFLNSTKHVTYITHCFLNMLRNAMNLFDTRFVWRQLVQMIYYVNKLNSFFIVDAAMHARHMQINVNML